MPRARTIPRNFTVDNSAFSDAINNYVAGRATIENPTMHDYVNHYGSNGAVADRLVAAGAYTNRKSAMRQVQRLLKNPDIKLRGKTQDALGTLKVPETSVTISIKGIASYDGSTWRRMNFTPPPFTPAQMREIVHATQEDGNSGGIDAFMRLYGVGTTFSFLTEDLSVELS